MARGPGPGGELPSAGRPTRRAVLAGALLVGAGAVTGCGGKSATPPPEPRPTATPEPDPDPDLIRSVLADKRELVARYEATVSRYPALSTPLAATRADHEGHVRALAASPAAPAGAADAEPAPGAVVVDPAATPTPSAQPTPGGQPAPAVPPGRAAAVRALAAAERDAADVRLGQCVRAAGTDLARLLGSIGACEAAHGVVLTELAEAVSS